MFLTKADHKKIDIAFREVSKNGSSINPYLIVKDETSQWRLVVSHPQRPRNLVLVFSSPKEGRKGSRRREMSRLFFKTTADEARKCLLSKLEHASSAIMNNLKDTAHPTAKAIPKPKIAKVKETAKKAPVFLAPVLKEGKLKTHNDKIRRQLRISIGGVPEALTSLLMAHENVTGWRDKEDGCMVVQGDSEAIAKIRESIRQTGHHFNTHIVAEHLIVHWPHITTEQTKLFLKEHKLNKEFETRGNRRVWIRKKGDSEYTPIFSLDHLHSLDWASGTFLPLIEAQEILDTVDKDLDESITGKAALRVAVEDFPLFYEMAYHTAA